jgi:prephenate dehydrogenase
MLGASIGSIIPGLGTIAGGVIGGAAGLVGGLFGGASRKRKLRKQIYNAQQLTDRTNQFNRSDADTSALQ